MGLSFGEKAALTLRRLFLPNREATTAEFQIAAALDHPIHDCRADPASASSCCLLSDPFSAHSGRQPDQIGDFSGVGRRPFEEFEGRDEGLDEPCHG